MGIFSGQLANVVEWPESRDDVIFWKWHNQEIKKDSRLIIRPGQDAIFLYNGRIEGVFQDEGNYEISSDIIPFLSTLKGFKFGFKTSLRAEVLFVNTREFLLRWGTKNAINVPAKGLPGGLPIRCFGTCTVKVTDYIALMDQVAGVRDIYRVSELEERVMAVLDQYLTSAIVKEGKDMFNLQAQNVAIASDIRFDLDMELHKIGMSCTSFVIQNFSYPKEIQDRINDVASTSMVGDMQQYQQVHMVDALDNGGTASSTAGTMASDMVGMMAGMTMAGQMMNQLNAAQGGASSVPSPSASGPAKFCPNCGQPLDGTQNFCPNCGQKLG